MQIQTLNDRITHAAKLELEREVREACERFDQLLTDGTSWTIKIPLRHENGCSLVVDGQDQQGYVRWYDAMAALKRAAIERNLPRAQQDAIDKFLANYEHMQQEIASLKEGSAE